MIRLSRKRKSLIAGAAGLCLAVPAAFSMAPQFGLTAARAGEPARLRNPNHVLHAAVDRELSELGIEAGASTPDILPTAGEIQPVQGGQPTFNQQQYQSEVQRQLQKLYQQDGRPMPRMVPTPQISQETWQEYQQRHGQMPTSGRRRGRWDWLKPGNWRRQWERRFQTSQQPAPQPPEAPEFNPESLNAPSQVPSSLSVHPLETGSSQGTQPSALPATPPAAQVETTQPRLFPGLLEEMQGPVADTPVVEAPVPVVEAPVADVPPVADATPSAGPTLILMPVTPDGELTEPVAAPPVIDLEEEFPFADSTPVQPEPEPEPTPDFDYQFERERLPSLDSVVQERTTEPVEDPLSDPFPEMPENAADQRGPYSGLELDLDPFADPVPGTADQPGAEDDNPFAPFVERRAESSVTVKPELPEVDELGPSLQGPGLPAEPATLPQVELRELPVAPELSETPDRPAHSQGVQQKMARIAAREGLTGLKGFCPVVLRDRRDLANARAEYTVIYAGTQYWFSSEEARQAFLMSPEAYAPVDGGIDLVHFENTGEQQEGKLDHAAWFRGRLHLFNSAENKAEFIANPRAYSADE